MKYLGTCAALIERTGEWARIEVVANKNTAAAMTSRIAHSRRRPWTGHVWDARYAEQPDGSYAVYVRHLSQNPPEPGDAA